MTLAERVRGWSGRGEHPTLGWRTGCTSRIPIRCRAAGDRPSESSRRAIDASSFSARSASGLARICPVDPRTTSAVRTICIERACSS